MKDIAEITSMIITRYGTIGIFLLMFCNGLLLTPSSDWIMCTAGFLSKMGFLNLLIVIIVGTGGNVLGTGVLYFISYIWGEKWIISLSKSIEKLLIKIRIRESFLRYTLIKDSHLKVLKDYYFARYGMWIVFIFRLVPTLRSVISIPAGIIKMPAHIFFIFTFSGCLLWVIMMTFIGWLLGIQKIELGNYSFIFFALVILLIIFWFNLFFRKRLEILSRKENF